MARSVQDDRRRLAGFLADHIEPVRRIDREAAGQLVHAVSALGLGDLPPSTAIDGVWTRALLLRSLQYAVPDYAKAGLPTDRLQAAITLLQLPAPTRT